MTSNQSDFTSYPLIGPHKAPSHRGPLATLRSALGGCPPLTIWLCACALMLGGALAACPGAAAPGYYCVGGVEAVCSAGAYCVGGAAGSVSCMTPANCAMEGLSAEPPCVWSVTTFAGSGGSPLADGQGTAATFSDPAGVATDASGLVYVADHINNLIRAVSSFGLVSTLAGSGTAKWADGTGAAASFSRPFCVATYPGLGIIYVSDRENHRIRKLTPSGVTTTFAGSGSGAWADGLGTSAHFCYPNGLTVDSAGVVYVADRSNNRIRKITPLGAVTTLAGTGSASFSNGVGTSSTTFFWPSGITVDGGGNVYVGDTGNARIRLILPNGEVSTFAGNGNSAWMDGSGTFASFRFPYQLSIAANGNLLLADQGNCRLRMITPLGVVTTIAGDGSCSFLDGYGTASRFSGLLGITSNSTGALFVGDSGNGRLRALTCMPCPDSYYCSSGLPVLCPAGTFCPLSSTNPTPCPPGTYSTTAGATSSATCTPCPLGSFCFPGAAQPYPCAAGYFGAAGNLTNATCSGACSAAPGSGCAAGSVSPANATLCAVGFFCPGGTPAPATPCMTPANCAVTGLSAEPPCVWSVTTLAGSGSASFSNGQGTAATFNEPHGVAADASGVVYVADRFNHRIRAVTPSGLVSTLAGSGSATWADGTGTAASFNSPHDVATYPGSGIIYVADTENHRIRSLTPSGVTATFAGSGSRTWADGQGTSASFRFPGGLAVDSTGVVYVADGNNHRIRKITPLGAVTTLAGTGQCPDNACTPAFSNGVGTSSATFFFPFDVAVDGSGNVYVADWGHNCIRLILSNGTVSIFAGGGGGSWADGTGTFAGFYYPKHLSFAANGNLLVADSNNNRIRMISPLGVVTTIAALGGSTGSFLDGYGTASLFNFPVGVTVNSIGTLYIGDRYNNRIRALTCVLCPAGYSCSSGAPIICPAGSFCPLSSLTPTQCPVGSYSPAGSASCATCPVGTYASAPSSCAACSPATACTASGLAAQPPCYWNVSTLAGSGVAGWADGLGTAAIFNEPHGLSVDPVTLSLYVGDMGNNRIRRITSGLVSTLAGSGTRAWADGLGTSASFYGPHGISVDAYGNVFVGDWESNRVRKILPSGLVSTLAGSGTAGGANGIGTAAQLNNPTDIALDSSGTMGYIVEQGGSRIRSIVLSTAVVSTLAGSGTAGFADNANGFLAQFFYPTSAVWHPSGVLYVADNDNQRVRSITVSNTTVSTLAGNGIAGGVDGAGTTATFNRPRGITLDATFSTLYVAEENGNRIRSISLSTALVSTIAGSGAASYANGFGASAGFYAPIFLASSPSGVLFAAERNNRIRQLSCVPCPASYYCSTSVPLLCPAGSYCPLSTINPTPCPTGTFSNAAGASSISACSPCAAGTYSTTPGANSAAACLPCTVGSYSHAGSASCPFNATTLSATATPSSSRAPSATATLSTSQTPSGTATLSTSRTPSVTATLSTTRTQSATATLSTSWTPSATATPSTSRTPSVTATPSSSRTPSVTVTLFTSQTPSKTPSSKSPSPTNIFPVLCAPGYFCPGGMPVPAIPCMMPANCAVTGLSAEPPCMWNVTTLAGSGSASFANGQGTVATFNEPLGVAADASGVVYVADGFNHRIRAVTPSGLVSTLAGSGSATWADGTGAAASFYNPYGVATYPGSGIIYVSEPWSNRIRKLTPSGVTTTFAGSGFSSWADGQGTFASFNFPNGLTVDSAGVVYVADQENHRIRKITPLGAVTTLAGTGSSTPFSNGVGASTASFANPSGVAVDGRGNVYVGDGFNYRIRLIIPNGTVSTFAGNGSATWADGIGTSAAFNYPYHLSFAANGNLLVADSYNNRIRMITPLGVVTTISGSTASFRDGTSSLFKSPMGVTVSSSGTLYVSDVGNHRILALTCIAFSTLPSILRPYTLKLSGVLVLSWLNASTSESLKSPFEAVLALLIALNLGLPQPTSLMATITRFRAPQVQLSFPVLRRRLEGGTLLIDFTVRLPSALTLSTTRLITAQFQAAITGSSAGMPSVVVSALSKCTATLTPLGDDIGGGIDGGNVGLTHGAIIGIVFSCAIAAGAGCFCCYSYSKRKRAEAAVAPSATSSPPPLQASPPAPLDSHTLDHPVAGPSPLPATNLAAALEAAQASLAPSDAAASYSSSVLRHVAAPEAHPGHRIQLPLTSHNYAPITVASRTAGVRSATHFRLPLREVDD